MRKNNSVTSGFLVPRVALACTLLLAAGLLAFYSFAANPPSGTLNAANPKLTYTTGPNVQSNPSGFAGTLVCNAAAPCDDFNLTVNATGFVGTHNIVITVVWPNNVEDYDVYVHQGQNPPGPVLKTAASSADPEIAIIDAVSGLYTIRVVPFAVAGSTFTATVEFVAKPSSVIPAPPGPGTPRYHNFAAPEGMGNSAGEPTLGAGLSTQPAGGRTMYIAGLETLRVTWNDCSSPASAPTFPAKPADFTPLWEDKSFIFETLVSLDPILFTDFGAGRPSPSRTFVSQLGPKTSFLAYSDDDGESYLQSQGSGINSGVDHQNIGAGPYNAEAVPPPPPSPLYPNAVYYASQDAAVAQMARSDTGGLTFGAAIPMYNLTQCGGLHGHIKVAPDGTVYLPNKGCGTGQGVVVSEDNGLTFQIRTVPGSSPGDTDPSLGIDAEGKIYFAFADGDGRAKVAFSNNKGVNWSDPVDVGLPFGIKNTVFPSAVGGSAGRAAVMYLATDMPGGFEATDVFEGVWHIYASHTFDGGATWTTVQVTPENDPVQRGSICTSGLNCGGDRNLLDFNDMEIDHEGRAIIAYADGCIGCTSPTGADSRAAKATIARQSGGKRLLVGFGPENTEPNEPAAPRVESVTREAAALVRLRWSAPDNGGASLTGYNVYRKQGTGGAYVRLGTGATTLTEDKTTYDDTTASNQALKYFYKVTAVNSEGESSNCGNFPVGTAVVDESPCLTPGITIGTDPAGDATTALDSQDLRKISIAEPFFPEGAEKLIFTIKVEGGLDPTPPPNTTWYEVFTYRDVKYYVAMTTGDTPIPAFEYGRIDVGPGGVNQQDSLGAADAESTFSADGTIIIFLSNSKLNQPVTIGGAAQPTPVAGDQFTNVIGEVRALVGGGGTGLIVVVDDTGPGNYTLVGNAFCAPNAPPIAALAATPRTGDAPLTVNFDADGSSDPDAGDSVVSYTFNFGDGSAVVTQSSPAIKHTYAEDGNYQASVRVTDSRDKLSDNTAGVVIQVGVAQAAQLLNISTRARVQTGDNILIGGFIVTGSGPTKVLFRGLGPSLKVDQTPIPGRLEDPTLEIHDEEAVIGMNDNWKENQAAVEASGLPPSDDREAAIVLTLEPGEYTAILRGKNESTGVGLVEIYDLSGNANAFLANLSTRGFVETGDNVMIGGLIVGPDDANATRVLVRALGPSLKNKVSSVLADPTLEVFDQNGTAIADNDNWMQSSQRAEIEATTLAPEDEAESAVLIPTLPPGEYTAIVRGKNNSTGLGLVDVFNLGSP